MIASHNINRHCLEGTVRNRQGRTRWLATRLAVLALTAFALAPPAAAGCDDDDRPGAPHSLKANPLGSGGIILQWSSNAGHYDIYIRDKQGRAVPEAPDIVGGATNRNSHEFYGLKPGKEYFFSIRARSEGGTQGCISKNTSETVSAKTDSADVHKFCSNYARNAMKQIQQMQERQCQLPGSTVSGIWATSESTQFKFCLQKKRAGLPGDIANFQRTIGLHACKEQADKCKKYKKSAVNAAWHNRFMRCGGKGPRWTSNGSAHYSWCMGLSEEDSVLRIKEGRARFHHIRICRAKKVEAAAGGDGSGSGGACSGVPAEWAGMLKAHNDERAKYCGAPLTWSCDLAAGAQAYASKCILNEHGSTGENMADMWNGAGTYPAGKDEDAFEAVWGCERDLYDFTKRESVGGFKANCLPKSAGGTGVNGHFTQVVWRATTAVGCGRAPCTMTDNEGKTHKGTHWVCRYSPAGNTSGEFEKNVQKPPQCGQAFHSRSITCLRGMVLTSSGDCACPPGRRWNGHTCAPRRTSSTPPPPPGTTTPPAVCEGDRPVGTFPNCCPVNSRFDRSVGRRGACVRDGGGKGTTTPPPVCEGKRPVGKFPNCCPVNMHFERSAGPRGACVSDGGKGSDGGDGKCAAGTIGKPPNCKCPVGWLGKPPKCCPPGSRYQDGVCVRPTPTGKCTGGRSGTPPNCTCPPGTHWARSERCVEDAKPTTPTPSKTEKCSGGRIGKPPNCFCRPPSRYIGNRCRYIPKPKPKKDDGPVVR
jgi:hypothetical protein